MSQAAADTTSHKGSQTRSQTFALCAFTIGYLSSKGSCKNDKTPPLIPHVAIEASMGFWSKVGNAVSSVASAVGDAVETVVDTVTDTVEDAVEYVEEKVEEAVDWLSDRDGVLGAAGTFIGGVVKGVVDFFGEVAKDVMDIFRKIGNIIGSIFRLDLPGVLKGILGLVLRVISLGLKLLLALPFLLPYLIGGVVYGFRRRSLRRFVETLLRDTFSGDELQQARGAVGLQHSPFGFKLPMQHYRMVLDSKLVPLHTWHERGEIDLYAMAGLLDSCSFGTAHPNTVVKSVDENGEDHWYAVNRWIISNHLESGGSANRLRMYAMSDAVLDARLKTAKRNLKEMAVVRSLLLFIY